MKGVPSGWVLRQPPVTNRQTSSVSLTRDPGSLIVPRSERNRRRALRAAKRAKR